VEDDRTAVEACGCHGSTGGGVEEHRAAALKAVSADLQRATMAAVPLVYTVAEVAARLKVSPGTVRSMIDEGQLYAVRLHVRRIVVPKWALEELVARPSTVESSTPIRHRVRNP
jgi:excisionase family DNA binding protein